VTYDNYENIKTLELTLIIIPTLVLWSKDEINSPGIIENGQPE